MEAAVRTPQALSCLWAGLSYGLGSVAVWCVSDTTENPQHTCRRKPPNTTVNGFLRSETPTGLPRVLFLMNQLQALRETGTAAVTAEVCSAVCMRALSLSTDQSIRPDNNPTQHDCIPFCRRED